MRPGCLRAMLLSRVTVSGRRGPLRVYRCPRAGTVCVLSGPGSDRELLLLACEDCPDRPPSRLGRGPRDRAREKGPHHLW